MTTATLNPCKVEGCENPRSSRWRCSEHFAPAKRRCSVEGCDRKHHGNGLCKLHWKRLWRADRLDLLPLTGHTARHWCGDDIGYSGAHDRVRNTRGSAAERRCLHCGSVATDWAYDHGDPNEHTDLTTGLKYSTDPDHYLPLCRSCHRYFDYGAA